MNTCYAKRDLEKLDANRAYSMHVRAMTDEGLFSKSDIAAELAHRDIIIEAYKKHDEMSLIILSNIRLDVMSATYKIGEDQKKALEKVMSVIAGLEEATRCPITD